MKTDVWIITEQKDREITEDSLLLIGEARRFLESLKQKGSVSALAFGMPVKRLEGIFYPYGVERVFYSERLSEYEPELYVSLVGNLVAQYDPSFLLLLGTSFGNDFGARLAARLDTGFVSDCVDLKVDPAGKPLMIKPISKGMLYSSVVLESGSPKILTVAPEVLDSYSPVSGSAPELIEIPFVPPEKRRIHSGELIKGDPKRVDLREADIIVVAGRGLLEGQGFELATHLADLVGGTLGCTRPLVDQNILSHERQIGQTGKTVSPRLLIACGVSGAFEFTVGIEKAKYVIAIDQDPRARIFRRADLGIVGKLTEVLPRVVVGIKEMTAQNEKKVF